MPGIFLNPSGCCCGKGPCQSIYHATGCSGKPLSDVTIKLWDTSAKGTLCATGTTDANGDVSLNPLPARPIPLTYYIEATHPSGRFNLYSNSVATCGFNFTVDMGASPATGYTCGILNDLSGACVLPWPTTLFYTDSLIGAATLTYNPSGILGAGWYGSGTWDYGGCVTPPNSCPSIAGLGASIAVTRAPAAVRFRYNRGYKDFAALGANRICPGQVNPTTTDADVRSSFVFPNLAAFITCDPFLVSGTYAVGGTTSSGDCFPGGSYIITE